MRSLFFKIFIIFWIAQSLIFVISTALILHRRFPHPGQFLSPTYNSLRAEASQSIVTYQAQGCAGFAAFAADHREKLALADSSGKVLCGPEMPAAQAAAATTEISGFDSGENFIWSVRASVSGKTYLYLLGVPRTPERHPWYFELWHFAFPQLPVAIAVGGAATFVLVMVFTRPVIRLRKAARELAGGRLSARVKEPERASLMQGDEFDGLVHDFNHMAERLESLVNAQKLLLRDVSHELRSPLARVNVALELSREDANATMSTHLDRIERETERLNQLIGQLLTLSSMEASESLETTERVSLREVLTQLLPDAEYEAQQRETRVSLESGCDCAVKGRRELLYRAIENIVRNAIRYASPGSQVDISLEHDNAKGMAVLNVSDRGPGIPEAELQAVFRPFYKVDQARSPGNGTGGFGVGLAIAERAIKLHEGQILALNRPGGGTTIRVLLPAAP